MPDPAAPSEDGTVEVTRRAAEDQALASARHAAQCAARWWRAVHEPTEDPGPELPPDLARWSFKVWWEWFITDGAGTEVDDDDDEDV